MVLAGNSGAYGVNSDKVNMTMIENSSKRENSFELPKITNQRQQLNYQSNKGSSTKEMLKELSEKQRSNIFMGRKKNKESSPPESPQKKNEHESHQSSAYGKLTPVYDPKK